jgi:hypothetical protein
MASKNATFEIQVMRDGRWVTESYLDAEETAIGAAKRYLMDKRCEGARVVRNWSRADGRMVEKEVFSEIRSPRDDGPVRIVQIDEAPARCEAPGDYFGLPSRALMNRVFRNYLEKVFVTPTELLHNYKELKRIQDKDMLVPSAVDRVAFLQTRDGGQPSKDRRDDIFKTIDRMSARARRAEALKLPALKDSLHGLMGKLSGFGAEDDTDYLAMVVLSRDLLDVRNWLGKLDRLCRLAMAEGDARALGLLDGVIADVLGANVVQEILGWQPSLAMAIVRMLDLAEGMLPLDRSEAGESAEMLNALLKAGKLPASRACLIDRAHRQLKSANPLYRSDASKERGAFATVLERMLTPAGLLFGAETAEALTIRATRMVEEGGASGRRAAIALVFEAMPDRAFGLIYLSALAETAFAKDHADDIAALLKRVEEVKGLGEFCRVPSAKDRMLRATRAHCAVMASPLPDEARARMTAHVDGVLERYLIDEQIVEKLDHHDSSLRERAVRLVQFCAAGVLPEGPALARARERILTLLRGANFDARFVDGITDPAKAQKALRDFHQLLIRAGFGG